MTDKEQFLEFLKMKIENDPSIIKDVVNVIEQYKKVKCQHQQVIPHQSCEPTKYLGYSDRVCRNCQKNVLECTCNSLKPPWLE